MKYFLVPIFVVFLGIQQVTPSQIIDQIDALLKQLQTMLVPTVITVTDEASLQAALTSGGKFKLAAGKTFVGNFVVTKPIELVGEDPQPTLTPKDLLLPTLQISANDVLIQNINIVPGATDRETLVVGDPLATSADTQPHRVKLVGLTLKAPNGAHRGIALHGVDLTVDHCTVLNYWESGRDSQAIWINNGPGPYTITDNILEATGENLLVGGSDPGIIGMNPSNIVIRNNVFRKPESFKLLHPVKNNLEFKTGVHVLAENNTVDGWWHDGQDSPIQVTVRNSNGACTWCLADDITIRGTIYRRVTNGFAVNVLGTNDTYPSGHMQTLTIDHNLFNGSKNGIQVLDGVLTSLIIDHNTFPTITDKMLALASTKPTINLFITPLTFTNNVVDGGQYVVTGDGSTAIGLASLNANVKIVKFDGNIIEVPSLADSRFKFPGVNQFVGPGGLLPLLDSTTFKLLSGTAGY